MQFLKAIYKAVPDRLFSVIPGLMILQDIASRIGAEELKICLGGIREGYLIEHLSEMLLKAEQE